MPLPNQQDITAFDKGYALGYVHCLEHMYLALTEGEDTGLDFFQPEVIAERISGMIEEARKNL